MPDAIAITDPADDRIADYRALTDVELRTRWEPPHGLFIAEGELVLRRAVRAGYPVRSVLVDAKRTGQIADIPRGGAPVYAATPGGACRRPPDSTCTVVCSPHCTGGRCRTRPRYSPARAGWPILEDVNNHTNLGADLQMCGGARHGRRAALPILRGPALPPQRAGKHGGGVRCPVRAAATVASGAWIRFARPDSRVLAMTPDRRRRTHPGPGRGHPPPHRAAARRGGRRPVREGVGG